MKRTLTILLVFFLAIFIACSTSKVQTTEGVPSYQPEDKALYDTVAQLDSAFFEAYNTCKIEVMDALMSENIEFFHDRGGLNTSKTQIMNATKTNICGKVQRELLKGSIEVYPIAGFGAVEMGAHRFHNLVEKSTSRYAKFVTIWERKEGKWKMARVISLH